MCHHRLELNRCIPQSDKDYPQLLPITEIKLGDGRRAPEPTPEQLAELHRFACRYVTLFPEHASQIKLQRASCHGWEADITDTDLPGPVVALNTEQLRDFTRELFAATRAYADPAFWRMRSSVRDGEHVLTSRSLADAGDLARTALNH